MKACFLSLRLFYFWVSTSCAQIIWLFVNHLIVGQVRPGWPSPHTLLILADRSSKGFISQPVCFEIKFLFQCFLFAIVLFPTLPIRRFLQPRPKVGWALTSLQPRRSTNSTRFVLKWEIERSLTRICHHQYHPGGDHLFPNVISPGARSPLHPWKQTLLERRFRPHWKCHRCWKVISILCRSINGFYV